MTTLQRPHVMVEPCPAISIRREQQLVRGLDILADVGFAGLSDDNLCFELGVAGSSFHQEFGGAHGYVRALLGHWERRQMRILRCLRFGTGGPALDLERLWEVTRSLPHAAEAAIRAQSISDAEVATVQRRVDDARRETLQDVLVDIVGHQPTAKMLSSLGMTLLTGFQQLAASGQDDDIDRLLEEFTYVIYAHRADLVAAGIRAPHASRRDSAGSLPWEHER